MSKTEQNTLYTRRADNTVRKSAAGRRVRTLKPAGKRTVLAVKTLEITILLEYSITYRNNSIYRTQYNVMYQHGVVAIKKKNHL